MKARTGDIEKAATVLRAGGLVALPTETVYGLGANAENSAAVARIFQVKGRPPSHPLIVHIGGAEHLDDWAEDVPASARLLAERFWPGPLTLVLRRGPRASLEATGGLETVAVRVPDHPVALALLSALGGGIAAPSANRFGSVSPTTANHLRAELGDAVDFVLDGGACQIGVESTIVDATGDTLSVLRPGGVTREDLEAALGRPLEGRRRSRTRPRPRAPGGRIPSALLRRRPGEGARRRSGPYIDGCLRARTVWIPTRTRPTGLRPHHCIPASGEGAGTSDRQPAPPRRGTPAH
jgi:L-threonylcarbamoyladenylate synthase